LQSGPDPARLLRSLVPSFRFKRALRAIFDFNPPNWVYDLALDSRPMRNLAQTIFFHHRGLFCLQAWRDILRLRLETPGG
jgi:hypothetical protein